MCAMGDAWSSIVETSAGCQPASLPLKAQTAENEAGAGERGSQEGNGNMERIELLCRQLTAQQEQLLVKLTQGSAPPPSLLLPAPEPRPIKEEEVEKRRMPPKTPEALLAVLVVSTVLLALAVAAALMFLRDNREKTRQCTELMELLRCSDPFSSFCPLPSRPGRRAGGGGGAGERL